MSRRRRRTRTVVSAGSTGAAPSAGGREPVLRFALFGVLDLLLLTPFVVTPGTVYPFVVGKALWSRSLIAVAFALWALLALLHPGYRPPRSWLLVLLVAGYGATVLSAAFGVHPGHSLWSDYERMQGVVDQAHWVVLAVVLASVLHTPRGWRAVLQANLAARRPRPHRRRSSSQSAASKNRLVKLEPVLGMFRQSEGLGTAAVLPDLSPEIGPREQGVKIRLRGPGDRGQRGGEGGRGARPPRAGGRQDRRREGGHGRRRWRRGGGGRPAGREALALDAALHLL